MEIPLLDQGGKVNAEVNYEVKPDGSGISLKGFKLDGLEMKVVEVIAYEPWNFGKLNPGAGQLGIYRLTTASGEERYALIKDYKAYEGDWRILLVMLQNSERALIEGLMNSEYGFAFPGILISKFKDWYL